MTTCAAVLGRVQPIAPRVRDTRHRIPPQHIKTSTAASAAAIDTRTHISNLDRVLLKPATPPAPPFFPPTNDAHGTPTAAAAGGESLFHALNISKLFPSLSGAFSEDNKYSPRSLAHLHRLLSDSPRASPKSSIASRWRLLHGAGNWSGLLDPLDENLRRELVRYGDLVQSAYSSFHSNPAASVHRPVTLSDRSYRVTRSLFATSSVDLPQWLSSATPMPPWMTKPTSWIGFVSVCDNEREIARMGRRDIVVTLRGTATALEWAENFRSSLQPVSADDADAKVSSGLWSLYKTAGEAAPSLSSTVVDEVRQLVEKYKGEELSITITGHSLGAALGLLVADELAANIDGAPPIAVVSFGGPKAGNRSFAERIERKGVKVLRVVNAHDVVTRVPGVLPASVWWGSHVSEGMEGYAHVGTELRVDNRVSPYLRPNADPACCHDLEAYLHLLDGFMGPGCPFRANAKRSLTRLLSQQRPNMKKIFVSRARALEFDRVASGGRVVEVQQGALLSPLSNAVERCCSFN